MRFELDKATMILKSMSLESIVERMRSKHPDTFIIHTPENVEQIVIRLYFRATQFGKKAQSEEVIKPILRDQILKTIIRGVRGILTTEVIETKRHRTNSDGSLELRSVYAIKTTGTNIYGVLMNKKIDPLRVVSSSIGDTAKIFGIAAARKTIAREIRRFMGAKAPNVRHLLLYADEMTRTGRVTSLEKGGVNIRERNNVLLRMAMSAPTQVIQDAAINNMKGRVFGVAPHLILGHSPRLGTTWNEFVVDGEFVRKRMKTIDDVMADVMADF